MNFVALKMLVGDRAKYLGIIMGLTFASLLITQQLAIFIGLMARTYGAVTDLALPAVGKVILGQRPEDIRLAASGAGDLAGEVFSTELLGDSALVTVRLRGGDLISVKTGPEVGLDIDEPVGVVLSRERLHLFDQASGRRLDT